jgi:hypothetical protein
MMTELIVMDEVLFHLAHQAPGLSFVIRFRSEPEVLKN